VSGPDQYQLVSGTLEKDTVRFLVEGKYQFMLQVRDNNGAIAVDTVEITVVAAAHRGPIANAGADIDVEMPLSEMLLSGIKSKDPDGNLLYYNWAKVSGPAGLTIMQSTTGSPKLSGLLPGRYVFNLTVTDITGAKATDQVVAIIRKSGSDAKGRTVAIARADKKVYYPQSQIMLNGNDSYTDTGKVSSYHWSVIEGPGTPRIIQADSGLTEVMGLEKGVYTFQLTVRDNAGNIASDRVSVTVAGNGVTRNLLNVYPNPVRSELNLKISSDTTGRANISVYNSNGVMVKSLQTEKVSVTHLQSVSVTELQKGVYYLEVNIGSKQRLISAFIKN
jgi:hypothetical protein